MAAPWTQGAIAELRETIAAVSRVDTSTAVPIVARTKIACKRGVALDRGEVALGYFYPADGVLPDSYRFWSTRANYFVSVKASRVRALASI